MIREVETTEELGEDLVGPVIRSRELADAVIEAVEQDNPASVVTVLDRGGYVRIHTEKNAPDQAKPRTGSGPRFRSGSP